MQQYRTLLPNCECLAMFSNASVAQLSSTVSVAQLSSIVAVLNTVETNQEIPISVHQNA